MPPPIWKRPIELLALCDWYQDASVIMYSMPDRTVCTFLSVPWMQCAAKMLPSVESSQPGTKIGRLTSDAAISQLSAGSIS